MYKRLQFAEKEAKEIDFRHGPKRLKGDYLIYLKEMSIQPSMMRTGTLVQLIWAGQT